jgi:hypothetical protein
MNLSKETPLFSLKVAEEIKQEREREEKEEREERERDPVFVSLKKESDKIYERIGYSTYGDVYTPAFPNHNETGKVIEYPDEVTKLYSPNHKNQYFALSTVVYLYIALKIKSKSILLARFFLLG